jgi:ribosomal protein S18 acetylase RimI-like enzyme
MQKITHSSARDARPVPPIRELDLTDGPTAAAVHRTGRSAYAVEAGLIGFDGIPALRESLAELRERPLRWLGAVPAAGTVAAFVAWQDEGPQAGPVEIDRVCVDPTWFRRGLATRLLDHLMHDLAPDRDMVVTTGAANQPAVALYRRLGFTRTADFEPVLGLRMARFVLRRGAPSATAAPGE